MTESRVLTPIISGTFIDLNCYLKKEKEEINLYMHRSMVPKVYSMNDFRC